MPSARCAEIKCTKPRSSAFVQDRLRSYEHTEEMGDDKEIDTERKEDDGENVNLNVTTVIIPTCGRVSYRLIL